MAAFSLTASGIKVSDDGLVSTITAKEAITAGQAITSDGYVVDPEDSLKLNVAGIAVTSASVDDTVVYCYDGSISVTDTLTATRQIIAAPSGLDLHACAAGMAANSAAAARGRARTADPLRTRCARPD